MVYPQSVSQNPYNSSRSCWPFITPLNNFVPLDVCRIEKGRSIMDDVADRIEDTSPASVLPDEMLCRIFTFLPLTDHESVRLVCRSWYDCCNSVSITKHEKFVFRPNSRIEDVNDVILRSTRPLLNLEFQSLPVNDLPAHFWKACSQRIRMLNFRECPLSDKTITNIIFHCENLTSFRVPRPYRTLREDPSDEDSFSRRLLDDLIEKGIRRPNLHTLSIYISLENLEEGMLSKISLIYPCILHIDFRTVEAKYKWRYLRTIADSSLNLDQCLNSDTPLESITHDASTHGKLMETLVSKGGQRLVRLKYLETDLSLDRSAKDTTFNFFKLQRNLEVLRLELWETLETIDVAEFMVLFFHILDSCPNLREFRLRTQQYMLLEYSDVPRFFTSISKLNSLLNLDCKLSGSKHLPWFSELPTNPVQLNLTILRWDGFPYDNPDVCTAFLQRCPSLQHLYLPGEDCCDTTFQIIFQYLPGLQTLVVLSNKGNFTDFGFTGRDADGKESGYSIKSLHQLKCFDLRTYPFEFQVTEKTALEFRLPRLEFLSLDVGWFNQILSEETLDQLASHLPRLKVLTIPLYLDKHFMENTIQLCKRLRSLRRLRLCSSWEDGDRKFYKELSEIIFSSCSHLRYISLLRQLLSFRDPNTGEVIHGAHWQSDLKFSKNIFD